MRKCLLLITKRHACINVNVHIDMIVCKSFGRQKVENKDVSACLHYIHVYLQCKDHILIHIITFHA